MNRPGGAALLALPLGVAQLLLFAAPLLLLTATSFSQDENLRGFSLRAWGELLGDGFNLRALLNTMKLGALTVLSATVLAVPLGLVHQVAGPKLRRAILIAAVLPLLTSVVVRSFAWIAILGREGVISQTLQATGLAASPVQLLQTEPGLILALTQIEMPLMLLPLLSRRWAGSNPRCSTPPPCSAPPLPERSPASCCLPRCQACSPAPPLCLPHPRRRSSRRA